ncbi:MAG: hypothetical protein ACRDNS_30150, partial [Trebonia sp.]
MGQLHSAVGFASSLYRQRAITSWHGYVRNDPMALLTLRPARQNPYPIYERLRAQGPLVRTRLGNWASTSHRVCNQVLRDRRFGVRPEDAQRAQPESDLSFLEMDPPDHTRLRRLAAPAFSPKRMAGYRPRIDQPV